MMGSVVFVRQTGWDEECGPEGRCLVQASSNGSLRQQCGGDAFKQWVKESVMWWEQNSQGNKKLLPKETAMLSLEHEQTFKLDCNER